MSHSNRKQAAAAAHGSRRQDEDAAAGDNLFDDAIRFGPVFLDIDECKQHFLFVGATGSGKTSTMRLLYQDVVPRIRPGSDTRALFIDVKQDLYSTLRGIDPAVEIVTLHPFDDRGAAWDMARDVREPRVAIEIAFTLIPQQQESQPFFSDAARHLLYGVMVSYMWRELDWRLADLIRGVSERKRLRAILAACPYTRDLIHRYFGDRRLLSNILSTIATKMLPFEPIAAAWEAAETRVSLEDWVKSEFVLALGHSETSRQPLDALNRCIFKRAADLHLNQTESTTRMTFWFLDELTEAGRLDGLVSLCKKARSKGGCVAISFQSIEGLRDARMYGPQQTADLLGQMGHRSIGRLECPETAAWASKLIGEQEIRRVTSSRTYADKSSFTEAEQFVVQNCVLPSEFMSVPPCTDINGLTAYYLSRVGGTFLATIPGYELFVEDLVPKATGIPDFVPRDVSAQFLRSWSQAERVKFAPPGEKLKPRRRESRSEQLQALKDLETLLGPGQGVDPTGP